MWPGKKCMLAHFKGCVRKKCMWFQKCMWLLSLYRKYIQKWFQGVADWGKSFKKSVCGRVLMPWSGDVAKKVYVAREKCMCIHFFLLELKTSGAPKCVCGWRKMTKSVCGRGHALSHKRVRRAAASATVTEHPELLVSSKGGVTIDFEVRICK